MNRPLFTATKEELNKYIDHLQWELQHKNEQLKSVSLEFDDFMKGLRKYQKQTEVLISLSAEIIKEFLPPIKPGHDTPVHSEIVQDDDENFSSSGPFSLGPKLRPIHMNIPGYHIGMNMTTPNNHNILYPEIPAENPNPETNISTLRRFIIAILICLILWIVIIFIFKNIKL